MQTRKPLNPQYACILAIAMSISPAGAANSSGVERQITHEASGHVLTNCNIWSPDGHWIVYDVRSDAEGAVFDGDRIAMVNADSGQTRTLYHSKDGAHCGVATFDPSLNRVAFILGPENPTPDWQYGPTHRRGVIVNVERPDVSTNLDARDLHPPRTPGALRGGSHVHVFCPDGSGWLSFTYNDALLAEFAQPTATHDADTRNVGVAVPRSTPLHVPHDDPHNQDGMFFSFLSTRTTGFPKLGSDEVSVAQEEGWIGREGYVRADGTRQRRALAFQGTVVAANGKPVIEVFVSDLPDDPTHPSLDGPLEGTPTRRPTPPLGVTQRRLTLTENRQYPGICLPRHWLRASPDGSRIATLMRDDAGFAQIWTVSPAHGNSSLRQVTRDPWAVASAFSWSPNGRSIAYVADGSVFTVDVATGLSQRRTQHRAAADAPLALACVFSPDGRRIAYQRRVPDDTDKTSRHNQIFIVTLPVDVTKHSNKSGAR
jgi:hypothetical protein